MVDMEKLKLIQDLFEANDEIPPDMDLESSEYWDSITKLALIVMFEEKFDIILDNDAINNLCKVSDIMELMN